MCADGEEKEMAEFYSYPEDAAVTESLQDGTMSGTRTEQVTYIAQSGGGARFPDIRLSWYNIETGEVEDILLPGQSISVAETPDERQTMDGAVLFRAVSIFLSACLLVWAAQRWVWPRLRARIDAVRTAHEKTLYAIHLRAEAQAKARDLNALLEALEVRKSRGLAGGEALRSALKELMDACYSDAAAGSDKEAAWGAVGRALRQERPPFLRRRRRNDVALPELNPFPSRYK